MSTFDSVQVKEAMNGRGNFVSRGMQGADNSKTTFSSVSSSYKKSNFSIT